MSQAASPMRSLERAIDVLEVLEGSRSPLRLSEISRRAGLHIATTQRILGVLESRGRVEQDAAGYRTGVAMLFGAHAYLASNPAVLAARPILQELASATEFTASAFVRAGDSRAVIARVEGRRLLRYDLPIGERLPLHLGAGKVLAAHMESTDLKSLLDVAGPITWASGETVKRRQFAAELARIRKLGYAVARNERVVGVASISAPVFSAGGACVAAVQVAGPSQDLAPERVEEISIEVRQAAAALSKRFA